MCLPISNHKSWWAAGDAFLPSVLVLARAGELHLCPSIAAPCKRWFLTARPPLPLTWLPCIGRVLQQIQLPRQSWLCLETWQAARAAERPAGFSLHSPLTRNPDVLGTAFFPWVSHTSWQLPGYLWDSPQHRNKETNSLSSFFLSFSVGMSI